MSEVDRLSNSGLYPALPIADRQRDKRESPGGRQPDPRKPERPHPTVVPADPGPPRPPKSIIDEYC